MKFTNVVKKGVFGASLAVVSAASMAAVDTTGVSASIADAETTGTSVGMIVAGAVATMAVVGVIIAMIKKI